MQLVQLLGGGLIVICFSAVDCKPARIEQVKDTSRKADEEKGDMLTDHSACDCVLLSLRSGLIAGGSGGAATPQMMPGLRTGPVGS